MAQDARGERLQPLSRIKHGIARRAAEIERIRKRLGPLDHARDAFVQADVARRLGKRWNVRLSDGRQFRGRCTPHEVTRSRPRLQPAAVFEATKHLNRRRQAHVVLAHQRAHRRHPVAGRERARRDHPAIVLGEAFVQRRARVGWREKGFVVQQDHPSDRACYLDRSPDTDRGN